MAHKGKSGLDFVQMERNSSVLGLYRKILFDVDMWELDY